MTKYSRRLQKIGSSLLISLPSEWIKNNNLRKGSIITIEINNDSSISLFPPEIASGEVKEVTIPYHSTSMDSIVNQIYGAYLLGYDYIRIRGISSIKFEDRDTIKYAMRKLVGLEIVDEDGSNITSQFLLDATTLDAAKILRRMNSIVAGMCRDIMAGLRVKENNMEKLIIHRDDEVDRQYFLLVRLIRSAMLNQRLAHKLNLSNIDILDYRIAANHLESAGDYITDFALAIPQISHIRLVNEITDAGLLIEKMQEKSVSAFVNKNRTEYIEIVKIYNKFNAIMNSIKELSANMESRNNTQSTIAILNSIYSLDKIARCWVDVADLVKPVHLTAPLTGA